jgi:hypothetical protein
MKKIIVLLIIVISLSSCNGYISLGSGGCGAWGPKRFEKDKKALRWQKDAWARNKWNRHY